MERFFLVLVALLLTGYNQPDYSDDQSDGLVFTTERSSYAPGSTVTATLANHSKKTIGYNICFAFLTLERQDRGWEAVPVDLAPDDRAACSMQLYALAPGETAETKAYLPDDLAAGTYRLTAEVESDSDKLRVVTESFEVR